MNAYKRLIACILSLLLILLAEGCTGKEESQLNEALQNTVEIDRRYKDSTASIDERVESLINQMTLDEKVGQMVQAERKTASPKDVKEYLLGSILSGGGSVPTPNTADGWARMTKGYQDAAAGTRLGIPIIYGVDAVHGHNNVSGAVVFPHNIGLGAAADPELMARIGEVTAEELIATGVNWNFAPTIAVSRDERWGRAYESYSEIPDLVGMLAIPYITSIQNTYNLAATAKHYAGDGGTKWGTGSSGYSIDQGNTEATEQELRKTHLAAYEKAVAAGVRTVMVSFSSWNGLKMHEHKYLIQDVLKTELKFRGFVVSDWEGIHQVRGNSFYNQVVASVNAGVDMLMEPDHWKDALRILKQAAENGDIKKERIDDAVRRILRVKFEIGLFEKPLGDPALQMHGFGSKEHREVAREAVRKSLVLLKNRNNLLPLKKNAKIFATGPAADDLGIQCGGWTIEWQGLANNSKNLIRGSTILDGFRKIAQENGGTIITDAEKAKEADVAVVVVGEKPYAEGIGDDGNLKLEGGTALEGNIEALEQAKNTGLPTVVILISGRPRLVADYIDNWDAFVAAWLPGTEGDGVAEVLYGEYDFSGKLSFTWPGSIDQIPINADDAEGKDPLFPYGYGLKTKE